MPGSVRTVHVVAKSHLDLGFTGLAHEVVARYVDQYIPAALASAAELRERGGPERLVWTTGSWILQEALDAEVPGLVDAVCAGDVTWHALPVTTHTELLDADLARRGLAISRGLDERFDRVTTAAKMTDVPGHTRGLVALLHEAGVTFLHLGVNPAWPVPEVPADEMDRGSATAERLADCRLAFDADFWNGADDLEDYLVAPVLARGRGHALYAPAKAGKSLFGLYVAACAATGRPVLDQPAGTPLRVVYADFEMTRADVRERLADMGYGADDDMDALIYYALPSLAALDTPQGGGELVALAQHLEADLVVIDTISRAVHGEENSNDTAQSFAMHTGTPLKRAGITLLRIDHAGMDVAKGARGASAKNDDVDVVWRLVPRDRGKFTLKATHRRMNWVPEVVELRQDIEPLRYSLVDSSWPAGTQAAVETLDRLGVPLDHGKKKARDALKAAGETMSNEVLMAALRFRRITAERLAEVQR